MKLISYVKEQVKDTVLLMHSIPAWVLTCLVTALVTMNLLANKSIDGLPPWLALDAALMVSWWIFLISDVIVKHYGPGASIKLSLVGTLFNALICLMFYLASLLPGTWGAAFTETGIDGAVNAGVNSTFAGSWYIIFGSMVAFVVSMVVNALLNCGVGRLFKKNADGFLAFASRSYVSTMVSQFVDNLVFASIVSHVLFGWNWMQCATCSATGAVVELVCEIIFSPLGYKIARSWKDNYVGKSYLEKNA